MVEQSRQIQVGKHHKENQCPRVEVKKELDTVYYMKEIPQGRVMLMHKRDVRDLSCNIDRSILKAELI